MRKKINKNKDKKDISVWEKWSTLGVKLPFCYDPVTHKPSITVFFPYASFAMSIISIAALHFKPALLVATSVTIMFWLLATVLYMIRKISKAKVDLSDRSIEIDGDEFEEPPKPPSRPSDAS